MTWRPSTPESPAISARVAWKSVMVSWIWRSSASPAGVGLAPLGRFFFQAEAGIRYDLVTGVQTCALPICFFVKPAGPDFERFRLLTDWVQPQRLHQPHRTPGHEPPHVMAADQRDVLAKFGAIQINQSPPVARLFFPHALEQSSGGGKILAQTLSVVGVNALVFFLQRDRQGQDLLLGKTLKSSHLECSVPNGLNARLQMV